MNKELSFFQCGDCNTRLFCGYVCHKCGSDNAKDCDEAVQQVQPENDDLTAAYLAGYHKGKEVQKVSLAKHEFFTDADTDKPRQICDRNGQVVLRQCKKCGLAESEITAEFRCNPKSQPIQPLRGEQIYEIFFRTLPKTMFGMEYVPGWAVPLARAIEAAHGIKETK